MNIAEANFTRLISGFLTFNARLTFTQLHEIVTSHNQLCSELLLRQGRFHLTLSSCLHGHIKKFYMIIQNSKHDSDTDVIAALKKLLFILLHVHCFYFHTPSSSLHYFFKSDTPEIGTTKTAISFLELKSLSLADISV